VRWKKRVFPLYLCNMEFFSKYAGERNKVARRHEKKYIKSLFKGFVKEPFSSFDFEKQDKDVKRYNHAEFRMAKLRDKQWQKEERREARAYNRE